MTRPSITCPQCKMTSWNPNDVAMKFCGNCHEFHDQMPPKKPTHCPQCGTQGVREKFSDVERLHVYYCEEDDDGRWCGWESEPFIPQREVELERMVSSSPWGTRAHHYILYDKYGCAATSSRSFGSEEECIEEARKERDRLLGKPGFEKVTVVLWPPCVVARGRLLED